MLTHNDESLFEIDWNSPDIIVDDIPEIITDEFINQKRKEFSRAKDWQNYVQEFLPILDSEQEFLIKLKENREERKNYCGRPYIYVNKQGIPSLGKHRCEKCPECLREEALAIRKAVMAINKPLNIINTTISDKGKELRRLRDKGIGYQVFYTESGCSILVDSQEIGEEFNKREFDYMQFTTTIPGKRRSGNLIGSSRSLVRNDNPKEDEILEAGQIMTKKIFPKFEQLPDGFKTMEELMEAIRYNVLSQTTDYAPVTLQEIQACIKSREKLIIEQVRSFGGVVYGVEVFRSSTHYVTEETPNEWLEAAQRFLKGKMVQLNFN